VVPNAVITPVSSAGEICFYSSANTHLLADINGWFASAAGFSALPPARVFDTRPGTADGLVPVFKQMYGGDHVLRVKVTGVGGVPGAGVGAVSLNVTVVAPDDAGYVTVFPCGARPSASNLNFTAGQVVPNAVITPVSSAGEICFYSSANTHLLADINGWFVSVPSPSCSLAGPTFVYPVDGQHLGWDGSWLFKVNPVPLATSYLWGFSQNGTIVWENYGDGGELNGVEYGIAPDTRGAAGVLAKSRFVPGAVDVRVRALLCDSWTNASVITIIIDP